VWPKLLELNGSVASAGGVALSEPEVASLRTLVDVLEQTNYYHSRKVPPTGVSVLLRTLSWPLSHAFPSFDLLRVLTTHTDGAAALAANAPQFLPATLAAAAAGDAAARPAALMAGRALLNLCAQPPTRALFLRELPAVCGAVEGLLRFPHVSVQATGAWVLFNVAHAAVEAAGGAETLGAAALPPFLGGGVLQQAMRLLNCALALPDEDARIKALVAVGSLAAIDAAAGKVAVREARAAGVPEAAAAAAAAAPAGAAVAAEVAKVLAL
jgi:hypothetical protein